MKILKVVFALVILVAALFTGNYLFFGMFLFGAVVTGNVLGKVSGKLGQIVGFTWKGIDVFRSYVIPANPQTTEQTTHRNNFKGIVQFGSYWLTSVIQPYWKAFAIKMSEFNAFVKENSGILDFSHNIDSVVMSKGSLFQAPNVALAASVASGKALFSWDNDLGANGEATDDAVLCLYYPKTNEIAVSDGISKRTEEHGEISVADLSLDEPIYGWVFFHRLNDDKSVFVSDSTAVKVYISA